MTLGVIVVDASVAAKWFLPEADSETAAGLLTGTAKLFAPALIRVEVAAAFGRRARQGDLDQEQARAAGAAWFAALADGVVTLEPDQADLPAALDLALALRHPVQDCLSLALALRLGAPLVTADRRFVDRAAAAHPALTLLAAG